MGFSAERERRRTATACRGELVRLRGSQRARDLGGVRPTWREPSRGFVIDVATGSGGSVGAKPGAVARADGAVLVRAAEGTVRGERPVLHSLPAAGRGPAHGGRSGAQRVV